MIKRSWVAALAIPGAAMADVMFLITIISHFTVMLIKVHNKHVICQKPTKLKAHYDFRKIQ